MNIEKPCNARALTVPNPEMLYCRQAANTHRATERLIMTYKPICLTENVGKRARFPDFPPRADMQNWLYLYRRSMPAALQRHLGGRQVVIAGSTIPLSPSLKALPDYQIPDILVSYSADYDILVRQMGYAIDSQGKPPEFALEVATLKGGIIDCAGKRRDYERYGVQEYWRFDPDSREHNAPILAGDRLVDGRYEPIEIEWLDDERCRGYSDALGLHICWEHGELRWYVRTRGIYLRTHEEEAARAEQEAARAERAEAELRRLRQQLADGETDK